MSTLHPSCNAETIQRHCGGTSSSDIGLDPVIHQQKMWSQIFPRFALSQQPFLIQGKLTASAARTAWIHSCMDQ